MKRPQYIVLVSLTVLVILTVLAVLGANLGLFHNAKDSFIKWGSVGALAEIIALFGFVTRELFSKNQGSELVLLLGPPTAFPDFEITRIDWIEDECTVRAGKRKERIVLVPARAGGSFRIQMPDGFIDSLGSKQPIELSLKDAKGNQWCVKPFYPTENMVSLYMLETQDKIMADYEDPDR